MLLLRAGARQPSSRPEGEGAFLACSFWLAATYTLGGRLAEARTLFERLLSLRNDVGLLAEEYEPRTRRQLGNFPQAFSHVPLVMAVHLFSEQALRPAQRLVCRQARAGLDELAPSAS